MKKEPALKSSTREAITANICTITRARELGVGRVLEVIPLAKAIGRGE